MSMADGNGRDDPKRQKRIENLKRQVDELTGGEMAGWKSPDLTPELEEEFLRGVVAYESAPWTTHYQQLEEAGVELSDPDTMDDEKLTARLWEVIEALARKRVFLESTNHLSDRELYTLLWSDELREEIPDMVFDEYSAWHIDLIGSGSEEDIYLWMKYYADEKTRRQWMKDWPDYEMPDHEDPPYDRDGRLRQA
ncbi:MAG TPA: hypothetical protein VN687_09715, partial [Blastocatellia bacterium]|nr:hypothetical protein [Blastocatellia bacterium]